MLAMRPYPGFQGTVFRDAVPQPRAEVGAEAAPADVGGLLAARDDPPRRPRRPRRADLRLPRTGAGGELGRRNTTTSSSPTECVPIGHTVNPNIALVSGMSCHTGRAGSDPPRPRWLPVLRLLARLCRASSASTGPASPTCGSSFLEVKDRLPDNAGRGGIGTPEQLREHLQRYEEAGVDQVIFVQQSGINRHEHICESLETVRRRAACRNSRRATRSAPSSRSAASWRRSSSRRSRASRACRRSIAADIPLVEALGRKAQAAITTSDRGGAISIPTADPLAQNAAK